MALKLTITYSTDDGVTWQTSTFDVETRHDGRWELKFVFYWRSATIVFEGNSLYAPSQATIIG